MRAVPTTSLPFWCARPHDRDSPIVYEKLFRLAAFAVTLVCPATAQVAILQIQVLEGDGAVHAPGSRSARPIIVEVTDETGRPVPGAAVSFHLPEEGPGGAFANGLHTEVAVSDAQGRVALHGLQVNRVPGRFQIRVIANKEQARAGVMSSQYVAELRSGAATATAAGSPRRRIRWVAVAALVGGGAAAGVLSAGRKQAAAPAAPVAGAVTAAVTAPAISIGIPATTVGRP
jgi:hypothetical protein